MSIPAGYQFSDCRGILRHAWDEVDSDWASPNRDGTTPMTLRCQRCGTERRDVIDRNGEVAHRRYIYPIGYHIDGDEKPRIIDFRHAWLDDRMAELREERKRRRGVL